MHLAEIWRYPVKSMAGERLDRAALGPLGLHGDRVVQVYDGRGRLVTARTYPRLLGLHATLGPDGEPLIDGLPWSSAGVQSRTAAMPVRLGPAGIADIVSPTLSVMERVALENAMQI